MVLKVFFYGMAGAVLAIFAQLILKGIISPLPAVAVFTLDIFLGAGLIEETSKYAAGKAGAFKDKEMDEPTDIVLYMIIAGLGFAALENILYLSQKVLTAENIALLQDFHSWLPAKITLEFLSWRFISATFLHALLSGILGYFIALSFLRSKNRKLYFLVGLLLVILLHGVYDWSIIVMESAAVPILMLIILGCFMSYAFRKLKRMQSKCQI